MEVWKRMYMCEEKPSLGVICHDSEKLLLVDFAILVQIELIDHRLSGRNVVSIAVLSA